MADVSEVRSAVEAVREPELRHRLGELGVIREVRSRLGGGVTVVVGVVEHPGLDELRRRIEAVSSARALRVEFVSLDASERAELGRRLRSLAAGRLGRSERGPEPEPKVTETSLSVAPEPHGTRRPQGSRPTATPDRTPPAAESATGGSGHPRVLGISSGKGGVGKSTVTVNLAVALARRGLEVGILDADIYGFSVPGMLGVRRPPLVLGDLVVPPVSHGVACLSMGFFVSDETPVLWRGPMLHKALEQLVDDAAWGPLDLLLVDMPPGTGDVALSMAEHLPEAEVVVVTTPQPAAGRVAQRSALAARRLKLPVRGVVENMSAFVGEDGRTYEIFGQGGGADLARELNVPLLGQIPLFPLVREAGDTGVPVAVGDPDGPAAAAFDELAQAIQNLAAARVFRRELALRPR